MTPPEFKGFPKIPRFRNFFVTITEKIDGTNAGVFISENGSMLTASRKRWITPARDNYGFAQWAGDHYDQLVTLGPGMHWGEWWGRSIQRGYDLTERRFSLFDVLRWGPAEWKDESHPFPLCCHLVPVLATLPIVSDFHVREVLAGLRRHGSRAAPGYMNPEGVVIYHNAGRHRSKLTFDNMHKGEQKT